MRATTNGTLDKTEVKFSDGAACCVVLASAGYPGKYEKGFFIDIPLDVEAYVAGAKINDGALVTNGGRVLGVIGKGENLEEAIAKAYEGADRVYFRNKFCRRDIGARALSILK